MGGLVVQYARYNCLDTLSEVNMLKHCHYSCYGVESYRTFIIYVLNKKLIAKCSMGSEKISQQGI